MILFLSLFSLLSAHAVDTQPQQPQQPTGNVAFAFALIGIAAGFSLLGSMIPFLDKFSCLPFKIRESKRFLSGLLAFSGGLMLMLALTDLLDDAKDFFGQVSDQHKTLLVFSGFFGGILIYLLFKTITRSIQQHRRMRKVRELNLFDDNEQPADSLEMENTNQKLKDEDEQTAESILQGKTLRKTTLEMAVVLGLHNIPEGVLIYSSGFSSSTLGLAICLGLIVHKLPEGIIISLPYYFSTKNSIKGFLLAFVMSSVFLFLGGILAYFLFQHYWHPLIPAIIFSVTSGVLFFISVNVVIPMARILDKQFQFVNLWVLFGAFVMALSSVILSYSGSS